MANWMVCPQCNYLIVDPSQPCPSCGAVAPASAMPAQTTAVSDSNTSNISNITMWIMVFVPVVGRFIERFLLNGKYGDISGIAGIFAMAVNKYDFWYVTFSLLLVSCCLDLAVLRKAGHDLGKYVWLIIWPAWVLLNRDWITVASLSPIYIFQRAKDSGQGWICFIASIVMFLAPLAMGYV